MNEKSFIHYRLSRQSLERVVQYVLICWVFCFLICECENFVVKKANKKQQHDTKKNALTKFKYHCGWISFLVGAFCFSAAWKLHATWDTSDDVVKICSGIRILEKIGEREPKVDVCIHQPGVKEWKKQASYDDVRTKKSHTFYEKSFDINSKLLLMKTKNEITKWDAQRHKRSQMANERYGTIEMGTK